MTAAPRDGAAPEHHLSAVGVVVISGGVGALLSLQLTDMAFFGTRRRHEEKERKEGPPST